MRIVVLDTETTGLEIEAGHRIIEIGAIELLDRQYKARIFHEYLNPERLIDEKAEAVHGINSSFLQDRPRFSDIAAQLLEFIGESELVMHNAPFDLAFLNRELDLSGNALTQLEDRCKVTDTLAMAQNKHPGQRNKLDALCKRYGIDLDVMCRRYQIDKDALCRKHGITSRDRSHHNALLDALLLTGVYLAMTGGQTALILSSQADSNQPGALNEEAYRDLQNHEFQVLHASEEEITSHERFLDDLDKSATSGQSIWRILDGSRRAQQA